MNLNFLSPVYLLGIFGVGLPILIHFLTQRRSIPIKFSAIFLLKESQKRTMKQSRPNRLLLMLFRCLALIFLSLALSKPIFSFSETKGFISSAPAANVFILDNSYSMNARTDKTTLYDEAATALDTAVRDMPGEFSLITAATPVRTVLGWTDRAETLQKLLKVSKASYGTTDIGKAVTTATELLESSSQKTKRIFILTDRTRNGWKKESFPTKTKSDTSVNVIDFSELQKGDNRAAVSNVTVSQEFLANSRIIRVKASVTNLLKNRQINRLPISIWVNGKKQNEDVVELPANGVAEKEFLLPYLGHDPINGYVEIEDDALPTDNRRHFTYQPDQKINVLVVDGDPRTVAYQSESFYLERALNPLSSSISDINPTVSTLNELTQHNLLLFPVVMLCNIRHLPGNYELELEKYVLRGGALFIALGDQVDVKFYNEKMGNLLPVKIESLLETKGDPFHLKLQSHDHPVFKVFSAKNLKEMESIRFNALYKVEPREGKESTIPMSFGDQLPAVVETRVGKGKVILYTSSVDRDWNDFPIQPTFLPWIQRWVKYAAHGVDAMTRNELLVGEPFEEIGEAELLQTPAGKIVPLRKNAASGEPRFEDTLRPGVYQLYRTPSSGVDETTGETVLLPPDAERIGGFTVNIDTKESDPEKISEKEIQDYLAAMHVEFSNHLIADKTSSDSVQLSTPLLLLVAFMFLCEGWLVRRE